ncbi:hypothetical protein JOD45_000401 [Scopulibacillus daqui]|uniref:Uncharacterized protein n=1 Tax=Scopulibacillus daqui TaxID=1469162 RepID=A0ABS2PW20_9BACL|nr:hypothetical protein [Scopulibacillus daqui]MBM7644210.1 hypothetical protein [Scopulibacillus daqui]
MADKKEKIEVDELRLYEPTNYDEVMANEDQDTTANITDSMSDQLNSES